MSIASAGIIGKGSGLTALSIPALGPLGPPLRGKDGAFRANEVKHKGAGLPLYALFPASTPSVSRSPISRPEYFSPRFGRGLPGTLGTSRAGLRMVEPATEYVLLDG